MCEKDRFGSKHQARRAVKTMGNTIRAYRCEECGWVHVTKQRKRGWK